MNPHLYPMFRECSHCKCFMAIERLYKGVCVGCRDSADQVRITLIWGVFILLISALIYGYVVGSKQAEPSLTQAMEHMRHPRPMTQAEALYSVWGLTGADVDKPNDIFADNK